MNEEVITVWSVKEQRYIPIKNSDESCSVSSEEDDEKYLQWLAKRRIQAKEKDKGK